MIHLVFSNARLLGTPDEQVWPGVGKLPNWHEYPQWKPSKLSTLVPGLNDDGYDLLEVSTQSVVIMQRLRYS
jgi:hypothetical protein